MSDLINNKAIFEELGRQMSWKYWRGQAEKHKMLTVEKQPNARLLIGHPRFDPCMDEYLLLTKELK